MPPYNVIRFFRTLENLSFPSKKLCVAATVLKPVNCQICMNDECYKSFKPDLSFKLNGIKQEKATKSFVYICRCFMVLANFIQMRVNPSSSVGNGKLCSRDQIDDVIKGASVMHVLTSYHAWIGPTSFVKLLEAY